MKRTFDRIGILFSFLLLPFGLLLPLLAQSSEICIADPTSDWEQPNPYRHYLHYIKKRSRLVMGGRGGGLEENIIRRKDWAMRSNDDLVRNFILGG